MPTTIKPADNYPTQPESDGKSFTLCVTVREVTFVPPTRDRLFSLSRVKCNNFEEDGVFYNGISSFHFYTSHEQAPKVGDWLEITVKEWNEASVAPTPPESPE